MSTDSVLSTKGAPINNSSHSVPEMSASVPSSAPRLNAPVSPIMIFAVGRL